MLIVSVIIEHPNPRLNKAFSYYSDITIKRYTRVKVSFNNRIIVGFVDDVKETNDTLSDLEKKVGYRINPIIEVIDEEPLLNDELISLAKDMSYNTVSPLISCLNTILPPNLKAKSTKQTIASELWIKRLDHNESLTTKQQLAYDALDKPSLYSEYNKLYSGVVKKLIEKKLLKYIKLIRG